MSFDAAAEWAAAQRRVITLVSAAVEPALATPVPACPDWTVRDLLAHMVGIGADVVAGREPDDHNQRWTAAQIEARRDRDVDELIDEWLGVTDAMTEQIRRTGDRPINDIVIHEQDLRGALRIPGATDTAAARHVRDRFADRLRDRIEPGLPTLALRGNAFRWASHGDVERAEVVVSAPYADLARAVVSRRSAAQLRAWTVTGDIDPYLAAFAGLGDLPSVDLDEQRS